MSSVFPPPGTVDCHTHIAGAPDRYPMVSPRAYTPVVAGTDAMRLMLKRIGASRVVLVQMSVFGTDNSCMLDAMAELGDMSRGVVQLPSYCPAEELDRLHRLGVRGIRVNLNTTGLNDPDLARQRLAENAAQCARNGWHLQLFTTPTVLAALAPDLMGLPVPVVLDHFGLLDPAARGSEGERVVRDLLSSGCGWVKVSGTYRLNLAATPLEIAALARDLYSENAQQILWGSDWPHTPPHPGGAIAAPSQAPYRDIDPVDMLDTIAQWFTLEIDRRRILAENPDRLYWS